MGPLGWQETVFIFVLALLIFGPKKLPELGKTIGKALTEFRRASSELKSTFDREMRAIESETASVKQEVQNYYYEGTNYDYGSYDYDNYYNNDYGGGASSGNGAANGQTSDTASEAAVSADASLGAETKPETGDAGESGAGEERASTWDGPAGAPASSTPAG